MLELIYPSMDHRDMWIDILNEWTETEEDVTPYALFYRQDDFDVFLKKTEESHQGINLGDHVPATTYFLIGESRDRILGAVNIRHRLNEAQLLRSGHIGYGVRPSERKKGLGNEMLRLALLKCREMGLESALVTCDKDNIASAKVIMKNGGELENEITEEDGNIIQRYWISLM